MDTVDSYDSGGEIELFDFQGLGCTIVVRNKLWSKWYGQSTSFHGQVWTGISIMVFQC